MLTVGDVDGVSDYQSDMPDQLRCQFFGTGGRDTTGVQPIDSGRIDARLPNTQLVDASKSITTAETFREAAKVFLTDFQAMRKSAIFKVIIAYCSTQIDEALDQWYVYAVIGSPNAKNRAGGGLSHKPFAKLFSTQSLAFQDCLALGRTDCHTDFLKRA